jgi:hypothetical protein
VDPKLTHNMKEEEKNNKNFVAFFENEEDKVRVHRFFWCDTIIVHERARGVSAATAMFLLNTARPKYGCSQSGVGHHAGRSAGAELIISRWHNAALRAGATANSAPADLPARLPERSAASCHLLMMSSRCWGPEAERDGVKLGHAGDER